VVGDLVAHFTGTEGLGSVHRAETYRVPLPAHDA
jgi:hypothetical protein